ncbi:MAG: SRPBCC family protein [Litoreibacter sp.]|nr:SRPBCC family protein [Litoreibacter sp.]MCY4335508.1 SRPBCC family protein [Litoreibacter sp.]
MKFSTKEDIEIPVEDLFEILSDFDGFERVAMRRGAEVIRATGTQPVSEGQVWHFQARFRGRLRVFDVTLATLEQSERFIYEAVSDAVKARFVMELVSLSRKRTRLRVELDVRPKTLPARIVMQSAKLARSTLNRRYKTRIAHFASDLEDRFKRGLLKLG